MEEKKIDDLSAFVAPLTLTNPPLRCVVEQSPDGTIRVEVEGDNPEMVMRAVEHICEAVGKQQ